MSFQHPVPVNIRASYVIIFCVLSLRVRLPVGGTVGWNLLHSAKRRAKNTHKHTHTHTHLQRQSRCFCYFMSACC